MSITIDSFMNINTKIKECGWRGKGQLGLTDVVDNKIFTDASSTQGVKHTSLGANIVLTVMNNGNIKTSGSNVNYQL